MDVSNSAMSTHQAGDRRSGTSLTKKSPSKSMQAAMSSAMTEALKDPPRGLKQPAPLANRVKDAGREFMNKDQICHWIQFMTEEADDPERPRDHFQERLNKAMRNQKQEQPVVPENPPEEGPREVVLDVTEQLKSLQKQQEALIEQQRILQEEVEEQKKAQHLLLHQELENLQVAESAVEEEAEAPPQSSSQDSFVKSTSSYITPSHGKRRLKGTLARTCAERDEGTLGSLIFSSTGTPSSSNLDDVMSSINSAIPNCLRVEPANNSSPAVCGRSIARDQESGYSVNQLISNTSDQSYTSSESSTVCTVVPMPKARDCRECACGKRRIGPPH